MAALEVFVAVGLIAGGLIFSRMRLKGDKNGYVFFSLMVMALCLLAVSFSGLFWVSVVLLAIGGVASVGVFVPSITMFQETPPTPDKGRLIALRSGFGQLGLTAGLVIGGLLGATDGHHPGLLRGGGGHHRDRPYNLHPLPAGRLSPGADRLERGHAGGGHAEHRA